MRPLIAIASIYILLLNCSKESTEIRCTGYELSEPDISVTEEYKIWRDVFSIKAGTPIIIQQEKIGLSSSSIYNLQRDSLFIGFAVDSILLDQFIQANDTLEYWGYNFGNLYHLISQAEIECLFQNGPSGWADYYNKYPNGYWVISRPGVFGDFALVEYAYYCGSLCAESSYLLLKKTNDRWTIEKHGVVIVS